MTVSCADPYIYLADDATNDDTGVRKREARARELVPAIEAPPVASPRPVVGLNDVLRHWKTGRSAEDFPEPCRDAFDHLAETEPARLAAWMLAGHLGRAHMSHAAEALGRSTEGLGGAVVQLLLMLVVIHPSPLVREGAVLGLAYHRSPEVDRVLRRIAANDASPGVRGAAADVLDD